MFRRSNRESQRSYIGDGNVDGNYAGSPSLTVFATSWPMRLR